MSYMSRTIAAALLVASCHFTADAHEFWIEPSSFRPRVNEIIKVGLRVGENFAGEAVPRDAQRIVRFASVDSSGEKPIVGREGADPAGVTRFSTPGMAILLYRSNDIFTEIEGPKFDAYLAEDGLDAIIQKRKDAGETGTGTREAYSRCAKALVRVGNGSAHDADRALGLTLEIVAEKNPCAAKPGDEFPFRVLHDGKPLSNTLVTATRKADAANMQSKRSDENGRVSFRLSDPGVWLIATVHMTPAPAGVDAKWQSVWASETFEIAESPAKPAPSAATQPATPAK